MNLSQFMLIQAATAIQQILKFDFWMYAAICVISFIFYICYTISRCDPIHGNHPTNIMLQMCSVVTCIYSAAMMIQIQFFPHSYILKTIL